MKVELFKWTPANVRVWYAEADYTLGRIIIRHGVLHGVMQEQIEDVYENNSGRDIVEQVDLQLKSRATKKMDIGYRASIDEAKRAHGGNTLGFYSPMLAKRYDQLDDVDFSDCYLQMKFDGHRCLVTRTSTGIVAYSRNGRVIDTIDHILDGIRMPVGMTIDGELYCHGTGLQTISSWVKKRQPDTMKLEYVIYDTVSNSNYHERYKAIRSIDTNKYARIAPTDKSVEKAHLEKLLSTAIAMGYEGLMLRQCRFPYEPGKRSKALVKVKDFLDDEFRVVGITRSADGWAVLTCEAKNGNQFGVTAPGTVEDKTYVANHPDSFLGKVVTVKYANLTEDGIPFHPVAVAWR